MQRRGAAEGDQRVLADDGAALDRMHARGVRHVLAHDLVHGVGRHLRRQSRAARRCRATSAPPGQSEVELDRAAGEMRPDRSCRARHRRRSRPGACRRGRSRPGPARTPALSGPTVTRFRASTRAIEPPPAPISTISITGMRTGRPEPFRKRAARSTSNTRAVFGLVVLDQADLGGGAAHVEATAPCSRRARAAICAAKIAPPAGPDSTRRTGKRRAVSIGGEAAARGHEIDRAAKLLGLQPLGHAREIAVDQRLHIGVGDRRRGALVFADLGADRRRQRDPEAGHLLFQDVARRAVRARDWRRSA